MGFLDGLLKQAIPLATSFIPGAGPIAEAALGGGAPAASANVLGSGGGQSAVPVGLERPIREAVPDVEPLVDESKPKSFGERFGAAKGKVDEFLGSDSGALAQNIGGQFLGDFRQRRNTNKRYQDVRGRGLNPFEASGVTAGAGTGAPSTTMGRPPAAVSAGHPSQKAERRAQELQPFNLEEIRVKIDTMKFDLKNKWPMRLSGMSAENGVFGLMAYASGMDFENILSLIPGEDMESLNKLVSDFQAYQSHWRRETLGLEASIRDYIVDGGASIISDPNVSKEWIGPDSMRAKRGRQRRSSAVRKVKKVSSEFLESLEKNRNFRR